MSDYLVELCTEDMKICFDKRFGTIQGIYKKDDPLGTNFIGNEQNTKGLNLNQTFFTGDVVTQTWLLKNPELADEDRSAESFDFSGSWQRESTGCSADIRDVFFDEKSFQVNYSGNSDNFGGIKSFELKMEYHLESNNALIWEIDLKNISDSQLEIGELGFPMMLNNHFAGLWDGQDTLELTLKGETPDKQKLVHENRVTDHSFISGHSSYLLAQRPLGDPPFLLIHPLEETSFEMEYTVKEEFNRDIMHWSGPNVLAIHSWAVKPEKPWINGHTSLLLEPGESRNYKIKFSFVENYDEIRSTLKNSSNLGIRILPSMVVQENTDVYLEIDSQNGIDSIDKLSDNINIKSHKKSGEKDFLVLQFKFRGQKKLKLNYNGNRWTNIIFYCVEDIADLIKKRGQFIINRQFYDNPEDPYKRHHMFLPFNAQTGSTFSDSDDAWVVGGSDEFGFSEPVFLAEKNVFIPNKKEVHILESYVNDCLFNNIQNPETYEIRSSLYYKNSRYLSSPWGHWTENRSKQTWRTYNYPHAVNIYYALYKIGKLYGILKIREAVKYLHMAFRTAIVWFTTGHWKHIGLMCGSNVLNLLSSLKDENLEDEYKKLHDELKKCNKVFLDDPYPYGSELFVDQTAHEQVYFFTRFFGDIEKNKLTLQVLQALRGGNQPVWFKYGNDKRGDMACWYSESLNGMALLQGYEDTGDQDMLIKGYAGMMSVIANLKPDGMGYGWFLSTPGIFAFDPPQTLDNGIGQFGFFKAAKSYVIKYPEFGLIGCGCEVEYDDNQKIKVTLHDGLRKRILIVEHKLEIEVFKGELEHLTFDTRKNEIDLSLIDPTAIISDIEFVINGLPEGKYHLSAANFTQDLVVKGPLYVSLPVENGKTICLRKHEQLV